MTKNLTVEMTFGQAVALYDVLKAAHSADDYYTERALKGDIADLTENSYVLRNAEEAVAKRARIAALITMITGEPFGDPTEAHRLAAVRQDVDAFIPQPKLELEVV